MPGVTEPNIDFFVDPLDQGGNIKAVFATALNIQAALCQCVRVVEIGDQGVEVFVVQIPILPGFPFAGHFVNAAQTEVGFSNKGRGWGQVGNNNRVHRVMQRGQFAQFILIFAAPGVFIEPFAAEAAGQPAFNGKNELAAVFGGRLEVTLKVAAQILGNVACVVNVAGLPFIQQAGIVQILQ